MKKIVVLLLVLLSVFSFSRNFEKKENKKDGVSSVRLVIKEEGNSYDFFMEFVEMGNMPRLRHVSGTAEKSGNKYVYTGEDGEITFDIQNKKVIVTSKSVFGYAIEGTYNFISNSTDKDYKDLEEIMQEN